MAWAYVKKWKTVLFVLILLLLFAQTVCAGGGSSEEISWGFLFIGVIGGLAFFLYGMGKMSAGMKRLTGNRMRSILAALTRNRVIALLVGAFVTTVIQSSSATIVMLVSFVQAGLMGFVRSTGVILGADIGTTITAQLIAFKLTDYALLMVAIGFGLRVLGKKDSVRNTGDVILGFGILFYGIKLMSDATGPLRTYQEFLDLMRGLENPLLGVLIGTLFTAVIQSSSASTGVVIVLAQQGLITLEAGIPLIFGANIGTCITAGFASLGMSREAKRVALAHVLFKVLGVMLFIFWIPEFADGVRTIAARFDSGTARQIANAHSIFNVSLGLIFLPFTGVFANLILKLLPDKKKIEGVEPIACYLDEGCISTPSLAIDLARKEISRMAKLLGRMLRAVIIPFMSDEELITKEVSSKDEAKLLVKEIPKRDEIFPHLSLLEGITMREEKIDFLDEKIGNYLVQIARQELSPKHTGEVYDMMAITNDMESIGDIIHREMVPLISKKKALLIDFSEEGKEELMIYHAKVCRQIRLLERAFAEMDPEKASEIVSETERYLDLDSKYRLRHLERVLHEKRESIETHEVHMDLMDLMKQISVHSSNIAKMFLGSFRERKTRT